jgi:hypothetical protein
MTMTKEEFQNAVERKICEMLSGDEKEIAKTKAYKWYQHEIDTTYRDAVEDRNTRGKDLTDERYWELSIFNCADSLVF